MVFESWAGAMAVITFVLAIATVKMAEATSRNATAVAEAGVFPKIMHNMRGKNSGQDESPPNDVFDYVYIPLISFDFYEHRPWYPIIRIKGVGEFKAINGDIEVEGIPIGETKLQIGGIPIGYTMLQYEKAEAWKVSLGNDKQQTVLHYIKEEKSPKLYVEIEFKSYTNRRYLYSYELEIAKDKNNYYVEKTTPIGQELPWDSHLRSKIKRILNK